jgi:hypothetical protein
MMSRITLSLKKAGNRGDNTRAPFLFDGQNPDFFSDTFIRSVDAGADADVPALDPDTRSLKLSQPLTQPDRLILRGLMPITFAVPPSPQPSQMSDPFNEQPKLVQSALGGSLLYHNALNDV